MINEESPLTRVQIVIGFNQISEISISMLHAFAALFTDLFKINVACKPWIFNSYN